LVAFSSSSFIIGWKLGVSQVAVYQSSIALFLLLMRLAIIPFANRLPYLIASFSYNPDTELVISTLKMHLLVTVGSVIILVGICMVNEFFVTLWVGNDLFAGSDFSLVFALFTLMHIIRHNGFMVW
jgi:O-antigen/teichoic acid export membrane protein